jgi:hypothetical protein
MVGSSRACAIQETRDSFHALANTPKIGASFCKRIGCAEVCEAHGVVLDELKEK